VTTEETSCGVCALLAQPSIYEDEIWHVRPIDPPSGVAGWMVMIAKRHVAGPAHFDDREATTFGPMLRHLERVLEKTTGALRIYTAALGESHPHFHAHLVPRFAVMPKEAKGWAVFDLQRAAQAGEVVIDPAEVERLVEAYRSALKDDPPPALGRRANEKEGP
jgi:diadenosine tetraphosphate (Ap4A) HIT family hydrolase